MQEETVGVEDGDEGNDSTDPVVVVVVLLL